MDGIEEYIKNRIKEEGSRGVRDLFQFLQDESYDSDGVRGDINLATAEFDGNINVESFGKEVPCLVRNFVKTQQGTYVSLSFISLYFLR